MKRRIATRPPQPPAALVKSPPVIERAADFPTVRQKINDLVAREALEMVGGAVDAAKDGQYGAMKCLFELVGLFSASSEAPEKHEEGLVETLLHRLGLQETPDLASASTKNSRIGAKSATPSPVK